MPPGVLNLKVVLFALFWCSAFVDLRTARRKREAAVTLCQPLRTPANGTISCGLGHRIYSCTAVCYPGYEFLGTGLTADKRECDNYFGEWFDPPGKDITDCVPSCSPRCHYGGTCTLPDTCSCQNGFIGKQCQYPASNCADPPDPMNGKVTCKHDSSGSRCNVTCNQGFNPRWTIAPEYVCTPDGNWTPHKSDIPDCSPYVVNRCRPLNAPVHGTISCGVGFPFYVCTATCDTGYEFFSGKTSDKWECEMTNGVWLDPPGNDIPDCVNSFPGEQTGGSTAKPCQPLPAPYLATIVCGPGDPFYSCTATCDSGYEFPGGNTTDKRECDEFGEWFDPPGKYFTNCIFSHKCEPLRAPAHGTITCGLGDPFYYCIATCDTGYEFWNGKTSDKRECDQVYGEWFDPPGTIFYDCHQAHGAVDLIG